MALRRISPFRMPPQFPGRSSIAPSRTEEFSISWSGVVGPGTLWCAMPFVETGAGLKTSRRTHRFMVGSAGVASSPLRSSSPNRFGAGRKFLRRINKIAFLVRYGPVKRGPSSFVNPGNPAWRVCFFAPEKKFTVWLGTARQAPLWSGVSVRWSGAIGFVLLHRQFSSV